jgi:hypothetical protein
MMWYGVSSISIKNLIQNKNQYMKYRSKINSLSNKSKNTSKFFPIQFYLPPEWDFILIRKFRDTNTLSIYLYSDVYYFFLPILKSYMFFYYEAQSSVLTFLFFFKINPHQIFWKYYSNLFHSFSKVFFKKLKFKGKGYYIYKNSRNTIALQFGYSHLIYLYAFFINVKFLTKTTILMFGINKNNVTNRSFGLFNLRPFNIFTGKGIRFTRQVIYRKTGKLSSYR